MPDHCAVLHQSLPAAVTSLPSLTATKWELVKGMAGGAGDFDEWEPSPNQLRLSPPWVY